MKPHLAHDARIGEPSWDHEYRRSLSCFPTGVCLAVIHEAATPIAITINSFCSISLHPPIIQFALKSQSRFLERLRASGSFSIYFLTEDQAAEATRFAQHPASGVAREVLEGTAAAIHCQVDELYAKGDHTLIFGAVESFERRQSPALVYYRSGYAKVA